AGIAGYAYLGDMEPQRSETRVPVELDLGGATTVPPSAGGSDAASQTSAQAPAEAADQAATPAEGENALD
ncbi:hypothetical protein RMT89_45325, partial [Streptomyces sp. P17]|nr:hypothetical protein [Streptomyces sp. P17]